MIGSKNRCSYFLLSLSFFFFCNAIVVFHLFFCVPPRERVKPKVAVSVVAAMCGGSVV